MRSSSANACLCVFLLVVPAGAGLAQTYPGKPIRMIIPAGAGGTVDTIGRLIGPKLSEALGQPVVADNRPGAGTMVGSELLAKSPPDGHAILMMTNSHAINASLHKQLPYDPVKDFGPVILVATSPYLVVIHPSVPAKSIKELIAVARQRPGQLNFSSAGTGSGTHLAGELFKYLAKIDIVHVPYKGGSAAQIGLASGEVGIMFSGPIASAALRKANRVRALAITSAKRAPTLPDLPTVAEAGVPGYESGSWYGVVVPGRTPAAIVTRLNQEIGKIMKMKDVQSRIERLGADATGTTPGEFAALLESDIARWARIIPAIGL
ncbi:MAG: tripartite tricarboxylate transporter substrate binding protein [Betaproteobacteria bacterium]|nr:tripartite tricarboxylate transporter substrate binding protein [Betaproteobacteria bacterium]